MSTRPKLNSQELLNAQYSGFFKTAAFTLGYEFVDYWLAGKVLTKSQISRMAEAELSSDILATLCTRVQSNKAVEGVYKRYEEDEGDVPEKMELFRTTLDTIARVYPSEELAETSWTRRHLFYSLAVSIAHISSPIPNLKETSLHPNHLNNTDRVQSILNSISTDFSTYGAKADAPPAPQELQEFISASTKATTDSSSRVARSNHILSELEENLVD